MKPASFLTSTLAATAVSILASGQAAQAFSFTALGSDWHVVQDSHNDGTQGVNTLGSTSDFEIFGMAAKIEDGQIYFAINSNLGRTPIDDVAYGDLFLNFTGASFKDASEAGDLFAVHFADNDNSREYGLYKNVTAESVSSNNSGHSGFGSYVTHVETKGIDTTPGAADDTHGTVGFGDLSTAEAKEYLTAYQGGYQDGGHSIQNVIKTGDKVADDGFAFLTSDELAGLDFGTDDASIYSEVKTFGFKFDASKLSVGNALITFLEECNNDGMAMAAHIELPETTPEEPTDVPEPASVLGLLAVAAVGSTRLRRRSAN